MLGRVKVALANALETPPRVRIGRWRLFCTGLAVDLAVIWLALFWSVYQRVGLFRWLGIDYGFHFSQTKTLWSEPERIYDLAALDQNLQTLVSYTTEPWHPLAAGPVPYPPIFAWLFTPFTLPSAPVGFLLWTVVNIVGAAYLAWLTSSLFPSRERVWVGMLVLTSFPIAYTIFVGQPLILLACAVAQCYLNLRAGRDFHAGLWLACLFLKPQYGILLGTLLVWKRQWGAVAGVALGGVLIVLGSAIVAGIPALLSYPASLSNLSGLRGIGTVAYPEQMVNWRALVVSFGPNLSDRIGLLIVLLLGAATVGAAAWSLRGPWMPEGPLSLPWSRRPFWLLCWPAIIATCMGPLF